MNSPRQPLEEVCQRGMLWRWSDFSPTNASHTNQSWATIGLITPTAYPSRKRVRQIIFARQHAMLVLLCVLALLPETGRQSIAAAAGMPIETAPMQFVPSTAAERELEQLLQGSNIDLAVVNWLIAADLPEFRDLTRAAYFKQLDVLTEQVRQDMAKMQKVALARGENLKAANTRCAIFCNAIIKLRFTYAEEFRQQNITPAMMRALYADANNICLAGLLRTRRGSCVSMPLIYLVLGQRLGMPVHLVTIGKHYFIRWEEPGYRMNIEPTIVERVSVTPDDRVYLETEGVTREQLRGSDLRNLTHREVVGNLLFVRSAYWATKGPKYAARQYHDLSRARQLAPDDFGIRETHDAIFNRLGDKLAPMSNKSKLKDEKGSAL